jgi:hypothetical protein
MFLFTIHNHRFYRFLAKKAAWKTAQDYLPASDHDSPFIIPGSSGPSPNVSGLGNQQSGGKLTPSTNAGVNASAGQAPRPAPNNSPRSQQPSQVPPQQSQQYQQGNQASQTHNNTGNEGSPFLSVSESPFVSGSGQNTPSNSTGRWAEYGITDEEMSRMAQEAYKRMQEFYQSRQPKTWYGRLGKWVADFSEYIPGIGSVVRSTRMALNPEDYIYERIMERGRGIDNSFVGEELANLGLNVASAFFPGVSTVGYIAKDVGLPLLENMGRDQNEMFLRQVALMSQANPNLFKDLEPLVRYAQRTTGAKLTPD